VRQCLEQLAAAADLLVVSATPTEALIAEWKEHDLAPLVRAIYGQEHGTKKEMLAAAARYAPNRALMIGDAPGDAKAASANRCLFFPIIPGREESSWRRLCEEGIDRFLSETFAGAYQRQLWDEFDSYLPEAPPWPVE
jgi:phosphoglycolate phosphatase-like HAD superfamily hydrolase